MTLSPRWMSFLVFSDIIANVPSSLDEKLSFMSVLKAPSLKYLEEVIFAISEDESAVCCRCCPSLMHS